MRSRCRGGSGDCAGCGGEEGGGGARGGNEGLAGRSASTGGFCLRRCIRLRVATDGCRQLPRLAASLYELPTCTIRPSVSARDRGNSQRAHLRIAQPRAAGAVSLTLLALLCMSWRCLHAQVTAYRQAKRRTAALARRQEQDDATAVRRALAENEVSTGIRSCSSGDDVWLGLSSPQTRAALRPILKHRMTKRR